MLQLTRHDWLMIAQGVAFLLLCLDVAHRAHCAYRDAQKASLSQQEILAARMKRIRKLAERYRREGRYN